MTTNKATGNKFWIIVAIVIIWLVTLWLVGNVGWHIGHGEGIVF